METILQKSIFVVGIFVLAIACRSFAHPFLHKLGSLLLLAASYLAAYFIFDSHIAGITAVILWFFLPWIELLTRVRQMRLPLNKELSRRAPPSRDRFPELLDVTAEIEEAGFEYVMDTGWDWEELHQFFRVFYSAEAKCQVALCLNEQDGMALAYLAISSRDKNEQIWRTWTFPFSGPMRQAPGVHLNQVPSMEVFPKLLELHQAFLKENSIQLSDLVDEDPETIENLMENEVQSQIRHNLSRGIIVESSEEGKFRYSWRGLFFLWTQILKDMVKLS